MSGCTDISYHDCANTVNLNRNVTSLMKKSGLFDMALTRSPATAGTANRSLLFLEHRIPMPELFTELRFSILREFWTQEIRFCPY